MKNNITSIPKAISQIKLVYAFKDYTPGILECIQVTKDKEFLIVDQNFVKITLDENLKFESCEIFNPENKELVVLAIDNKLVSQKKDGIADGAIFDTSSFHFVEFKTNARGESVESIDYTYKKAIKQLEETLNLFLMRTQDVEVDLLKSINVVCNVIVNENFPRINTKEQNLIRKFAEDNIVELSFDRKILF